MLAAIEFATTYPALVSARINSGILATCYPVSWVVVLDVRLGSDYQYLSPAMLVVQKKSWAPDV
jgi:hypothetical protein